LLRRRQRLRPRRAVLPVQGQQAAAGPLPLGGLRVPVVLPHRPAALRVGDPAQPAAGRLDPPLRVHHRQFLLGAVPAIGARRNNDGEPPVGSSASGLSEEERPCPSAASSPGSPWPCPCSSPPPRARTSRSGTSTSSARSPRWRR